MKMGVLFLLMTAECDILKPDCRLQGNPSMVTLNGIYNFDSHTKVSNKEGELMLRFHSSIGLRTRHNVTFYVRYISYSARPRCLTL